MSTTHRRGLRCCGVLVVAAGLALGGCSALEPVAQAPAPPVAVVESSTVVLPPRGQTPAHSPLPPGTALDFSRSLPQEGQNSDYQLCTAAWSFTLADGRSIAVTASHCGEVGDKVWAGAADNDFIYPAEPIGEVIYSDLSAPDSHHLDVAFVELYGNAHSADVVTQQWLETNVATAEGAEGAAALPESVCKLGRMTGQTCGQLVDNAALSTLNTGVDSVGTRAARAAVCGTNGDSGGPVFGAPGTPEEGLIVGVVSGTTAALEEGSSCADNPEMEMAFTPAADIQALIPQVLGEQA
ncbi:trypsin-like serine protease [Corynebacterium sp.]|uniref:trypsin-like serine protease n=1 Tax=Corynebacterium sp. TaxID=1720 RepID=UPI0026DD3243|nr:trypsin-like serine protease [Corynebacterium sp.]MDO5031332.1 serine protease [Corynebacterium sp.]